MYEGGRTGRIARGYPEVVSEGRAQPERPVVAEYHGPLGRVAAERRVTITPEEGSPEKEAEEKRPEEGAEEERPTEGAEEEDRSV